MSAKVLLKYWRTIVVVAEMTLRQQLTDGFIIFTVDKKPSTTVKIINTKLSSCQK